MELEYAKKALRAFDWQHLSDKERDDAKDKTGVLVACYDPRLTKSISHYTGERNYYVPRAAGGVLAAAGNTPFNQRRSVMLPINLKGDSADTIIIMGHTHCLACAEMCHSAMLGKPEQPDDHTQWMAPEARKDFFAEFDKHPTNKKGKFPGRKAPARNVDVNEDAQHTAEEFSVLQSMQNVMDYTTEDGTTVRELVAAGKMHVVGAMMDLSNKDKFPLPVKIFDPARKEFVEMEDVRNAAKGEVTMQRGAETTTVKTGLIEDLVEGVKKRLEKLRDIIGRL